MRLDMPGFEPIGQILIIHPELDEPIPNQRSNN
jgi:hypothetical protein